MTEFRPGQSRRSWLVSIPARRPAGDLPARSSPITALSVFAIERGERRREEARLTRNRAGGVASALERRANASVAYLRAGAALFGTVDEVPASLFRRFVSELRLDSDYRGAEGIGWAEAMAPSRIPAFEQEIQAQVPGSPRVHPVLRLPRRSRCRSPTSSPIPSATAARWASTCIRKPSAAQAMDEAERAMRPTASGKVVLVQEGDKPPAGLHDLHAGLSTQRDRTAAQGLHLQPVQRPRFPRFRARARSAQRHAACGCTMATARTAAN